jgi:type VI secretion system protein ImpK
MPKDLTKTQSKSCGLGALCTDIFLIVIKMREARQLGEPGALRSLVSCYLELFRANCTTLGVSVRSAEDAGYALVALLDETVLSCGGPCRDYWLERPLQLDYYGTTNAGEEFFVRLEGLMAHYRAQREVLEVYYLCMALGFEGKYKLTPPAQRRTLLCQIEQRLCRHCEIPLEPLAPHGRLAAAPGPCAVARKGWAILGRYLIGGAAVLIIFWGTLLTLHARQLAHTLRLLRSLYCN